MTAAKHSTPTLDVECSCGKTTYPSKPAAERVIAHLRRHRNKREEKPCRSYRCPERKGWHITSWASKVNPKLRR